MWLIALLLAAAAPAAAPSSLPLDELPPQQLGKQSCALFLWERSTRRRLLMAVAAPLHIRVATAGKLRDLDGTPGTGEPVMGFAPRASFGAPPLAISWDLLIIPNDGSVGGAIVRDGTLTVTTADGSAIVAPVAGLIGCAGS